MADDAESPNGQKRKRLSHACKACRSRKVRCDEKLPACTNCTKRGIDCITDDPRKPHLASVSRTRASSTAAIPQVPSDGPSQSPIADDDGVRDSKRQKKQSHTTPGPPTQNGNAVDSPSADDAPTEPGTAATSPWADPSWMRNALGSNSASIISDLQAQDRFKYVGSSNLQVFSHWIDLLLAKRRAGRQGPNIAITDHFDHGRIHSEEYHAPLRPHLPGLTLTRPLESILDDFFQGANSVFPIFDEQVLRRDVICFIQRYCLDDPSSMQLDHLTPYEVPLLATIYIITAMGLLDTVPRQSEQVKLYLDATYSLYGAMIGAPYLSSVQALLLLHLALRALNKDGAAWQALGSAIRIAYSIGLHRASASPPLHSAALEQTKARIWWCCYSLDRIATLDSGRPTMINDLDVQLRPPRPSRQAADTNALSDQLYSERYLACLVSLCRLKSEIHNALYTSRNQSMDEFKLFSTIASLDQKLVDWSAATQNSLQLPSMSSQAAIRAVSKARDIQALHLLCTYHFTVINVHRASVMLDARLYHHHIASKLARRKERLFSAETVCRESARAMILCITRYRSLHQCSARMISGTLALSAVYVLAICILKHPKEASVESDLALIDSIAQTVSQDYQDDGMPAAFTSIFGTLQRLARQCVQINSSRPTSPPQLAGHQDMWEHADISLEPLWESLGFGQVLSHLDPALDANAAERSTTVDPGSSLTGGFIDSIAGDTPGETNNASDPFQSLLYLAQPDELLYSLLGVPDFFYSTSE